ncbi:hypothetical protein MNBD_ALPHA02-2281 [hydrothermal vent metagenome]|uniref:Uncharacterized protein n=1 Tax=hydrothermal vent metagenome TaxID=652676 RepID=A0A3B0QYQ9_9ZZZZ
MSNFMHKLAESLRAREQYLEDHSAHPVFENKDENAFALEYEALKDELKAFSDLVKKLADRGQAFDETFERKIESEHEQLSVKIEAWAKELEKK